jgi:hypothetical protein
MFAVTLVMNLYCAGNAEERGRKIGKLFVQGKHGNVSISNACILCINIG